MQEQLQKAAPPKSEPAAPGVAAPAGAAAQTVTVVEFPPPMESPADADRVLSKCREGILLAADKLAPMDGPDPRPYILRRMAAWMNITGTPPSEEGRLGISGPDGEESQRLRSALATDVKGVLTVAEGNLLSYPLWLDLQHLVYLSLQRLGVEHIPASEAVKMEAKALIERLPGIEELSFSNGTALADEETRAWIAAELKAAGSAEPPLSEEVDDEAPGKLAQAIQTARELAGKGKIDESLELFRDGINEAGKGRERFLWRLAVARHCIGVGKRFLALDILEGLDQEARESDLDRWEPQLCVDVLRSIKEIANAKPKKGNIAEEIVRRMPDLDRRLARLDVVEAVRAGKDRR
jgi:type VI secretion system protein VasJ